MSTALQEVLARRKRAKSAMAPLDAMNAFRELIDLAEEMRALRSDLESAITNAKAAYKGDPGKDAPPVDEAALLTRLLHRVRQPKDGADGKSIDERKLLKKVVREIALYHLPKDGAPGRDAEIDHEVLAEQVTQNLISKKKLKPEHIDGLQKTLKSFHRSVQKGTALLRGGGDIVVAGTGIAVVRNADGKRVISATGGAYYTPTGAVNASNRTFGVTAQPTSVIADGILYFEGAGYAYAALVITMDVGPSQYIRYTL